MMFMRVRMSLQILHVDYFRTSFLHYHNWDTSQDMGYIGLFMSALLLIGAITYSFSKGKETRLIRYVLGIVLLSGILSEIALLLDSIELPLRLINILKEAGLCYGAVVFLLYLRDQKRLQVIPNVEIMEGPNKVRTSNWDRFFHYVVDLFTCLFIFTPFTPYFSFLRGMERALGEQMTLYIFLVMVQTIYFLFFELLFSATPAKFLTETRVVDEETEDKPYYKAVIGRTLFRFIPLEAFSFFGRAGWHDSMSETKVVDEIRTGVPGARYFWIPAAIPLVVIVSYFSHESYENYQRQQRNLAEHRHKIEDFQKKLAHLSTSDVLELYQVSDGSYGDHTFLKIEEIKGDSITAWVIITKDDGMRSMAYFEKHFDEWKNGGFLSVTSFAKADLDNAYTPDYDQQNSDKRNTRNLLGDDRQFEISTIQRLYEPIISDRHTGGQGGGSINMDLLNTGRAVNVVSLETIEGDIDWSDSYLPLRAPTYGGLSDPEFTLRGSNYARGAKYKFRMVLADTLGKSYTYIIEGHDLEKTIERVE